MYKRRTPGAKQDLKKQWALPDRVFFACGACHILAYAFLEANPDEGFAPLWIKPAPGHTGNHIVLVRRGLTFDYHGYSEWDRFFEHTKRRANQWWPGWSATLVELKPAALVSEPLSKTYDGLWLREPGQYLFNALPRAREYLSRFPAPPAA